MNEDRIRLAEEFLREAVYRSRESRTALMPSSGNCGLGERAAVDLDLTPRGRELLEGLFDASTRPAEWEGIRTAMTDWIVRQDAIDRKRNHFLKEFRARHGFDRTAYAPATLADFEAGLERINADENAARQAVAERLVATTG